MVKDFYIVPLPKDSPIPLALTTLALQARTLDENRDSLLLGIIVRAKKNKRPADNPTVASTYPATSRAPKIAKVSASRRESQQTPPGSGTSSPSLNYIPTARKKPVQDLTVSNNKSDAEVNNELKMEPDMNNSIATEDAPYSPGQLLNEESEPVANGMFLLQLLIAQTC